MKRRFMVKRLIPHIMRVTNSTGLIVDDTWRSMDLFIVGAGGSGGAWRTWGDGPGGGAAGGECVTIKDIRVSAGMRIDIVIGKGGRGVLCTSSIDGYPGGETKVTLNNSVEYKARGGNPGLKCLSDNPAGKPCLTPNAAGYDKRSDALGGIFSASIIDVYNMHGELLKQGLNGQDHPYTNPYIFRLGVPEFHEEGNPTHAGGGTCFSSIQVLTSFTEKSGGNFNNTGEGILIRGGGGYGGGGAGASYRSGLSGAGGDGGVVIRYYTYE